MRLALECGVCCGKRCVCSQFCFSRSVLNSDGLAHANGCRRFMSMLGIGQIQSAFGFFFLFFNLLYLILSNLAIKYICLLLDLFGN